ncbi:MAG TPA: hypothetical protein VF595_08355 [Tepidisphaeraceae bacterium]|jgi:hypothetical protein
MAKRFHTSLAGAGWCHNPYDVADIPEDEAFNLVRAGIASPEPEPTPTETAVVPKAPIETATLKVVHAAKPAPVVKAAAPVAAKVN